MKRIYKQIQLDEGEDILRIIRRSPLSYISRYIISLILILLPLFFIIPLFYSGLKGILLFMSCFVLALFILFRVLWGMFRNSLILTNLHIIDLDKRRIFRNKVTKFKLSHVLEVQSIKRGVLQKMFNYGNILFKIKKVNGQLVLKNINDPDYIKDLIVNAIEEVIIDPDKKPQKEESSDKTPSEDKMRLVIKKIRKTVGEEKFLEMIDNLEED